MKRSEKRIQRIREILPKEELRKKDEKPTFPTVYRIGDKDRKGNFKINYDDNSTFLFSTEQLISYPVGLPSSSNLLSYDLKSDIFVSSSINRNVFEQFFQITSQEETIGPYKEIGRYADNYLTNSFGSGSSPEAAGFGFDSKLRDKTEIILELPIVEETILNGYSGSVLYYDFDRKKFVEKKTYQETLSSSYTISDSAGFKFPITLAHDSGIVFDLFGFPAKSGIFQATVSAADLEADPIMGLPSSSFAQMNNFDFDADFNSFGLQPNGRIGFITDYYRNLIQYPVTSSNIELTASNSESLKFVDSNFLLEKAIIELPIYSGPNWLNDKYSITCSNHTLSNFSTLRKWSAGGPAVTFSLMSDKNKLCDIIGSATFVPHTELTHSAKVANYVNPETYYFYEGLSSQQKLLSSSNYGSYINFSNYVVPNIEPDEGGNFTKFNGNVFMEIEAGLLKGHNIHSTITSNPGNSPAPFLGEVSELTGYFNEGRSATKKSSPSEIISLNPGGIEFSEQVVQASTVNLYTDRTFFKRPYLFSKDNGLIISISKHAPCPNQNILSSTISDGKRYVNSSITSTKAHDIKIPTGVMRITLYGSQLKTDVGEFHDTLNQNLNSKSINEFFAKNNSFDEYRGVYKIQNSGSYVSRIFSGNFNRTSPSQTFFSQSSRSYVDDFSTNTNQNIGMDLKSDRLTPKREFKKNNYDNFIFDENLFIFDSLFPVSDFFSDTAEITIASNLLNETYSFPYSVTNTLSSSRYLGEEDRFYKKMSLTSGPNNSELVDINYAQSGIQVLAKNIDKANHFLCFGDDDAVVSPSKTFHHVVGFREENTGSFQGYGSLPRGFKYGMYSSLLSSPKYEFSSYSYGQIKDMIEYSVLTKEVNKSGEIINNPIKVKFVDYLGRETDPEKTWSSNLSSECTSSLPYFDNEIRNRESVIDITSLNIYSLLE